MRISLPAGTTEGVTCTTSGLAGFADLVRPHEVGPCSLNPTGRIAQRNHACPPDQFWGRGRRRHRRRHVHGDHGHNHSKRHAALISQDLSASTPSRRPMMRPEPRAGSAADAVVANRKKQRPVGARPSRARPRHAMSAGAVLGLHSGDRRSTDHRTPNGPGHRRMRLGMSPRAIAGQGD
jgi:hypothetical protein